MKSDATIKFELVPGPDDQCISYHLDNGGVVQQILYAGITQEDFDEVVCEMLNQDWLDDDGDALGAVDRIVVHDVNWNKVYDSNPKR